MAGRKARIVVENDQVDIELEKAKKRYTRIEDIFSGLKWILARDPEKGVPLHTGDGANYHIIRTSAFNQIGGVTSIIALYTYDVYRVHIESMRFSR